MVIENLNKNTENGQKLVNILINAITTRENNCNCGNSLEYAIMTDSNLINRETYMRLEPIIQKYIKEPEEKI
jgi:hypothetical protein